MQSETTPYPVHTGVHAQAVELRFYQRQGRIFEVESQDRSVIMPRSWRSSAIRFPTQFLLPSGLLHFLIAILLF